MSAAKHTAGPWLLDPPSMRHIAGNGYHSIVAGDGFTRGRYVGFTIGGWMSDKDACLIAAAPTMYEYIASSASNGCAEAIKIMEAINASR